MILDTINKYLISFANIFSIALLCSNKPAKGECAKTILKMP
jgi:hypothetical protein